MLYIVLYYLGIVLSILFLCLVLLIIIKDKPQDIILDLLHIKKPGKKKSKITNKEIINTKSKKDKTHQSPIIIKSGNETAPLVEDYSSNEETTLLVNYEVQVQGFVMKENIIIVHTNETISA